MTAAIAALPALEGAAPRAESARPAWPDRLLSFALSVYFILYVAEALVRWLLNMVGLDALIFLRDALVLGAILVIIGRDLVDGRVRAFPIVFAALLLLHGAVGAANLRDVAPVLAGAKPYLSLLIGAMSAVHLFGGNRRLKTLLIVLWVVGAVSAGLEKNYVDWPWIGMTTEIAGAKVELSRDWQVSKADKRAGGLARSSIHLAGFMSVIGITLFFLARGLGTRLFILAVTILTVYWTTQKGALIAVIVVMATGMLPRKMVISGMKLTLLVLLVAMIALPLILPQYFMPNGSEGVFSLQSFYDRAQRMWPDAWDWYSQRAAPFMGVGLGGIGFAMRLYKPESAFYAADLASYEPYLINFADNMFVYLYVQLGVMSLFYIGLVTFGAMRLESRFDPGRAAALGVLTFCVGYGVAVSIIEDQIACMFLGASAFYIWFQGRLDPVERRAPTQAAVAVSAPPVDIHAVPFKPRINRTRLA